MLASLVLFGLLLQSGSSPQDAKAASPPVTVTTASAADKDDSAALLKVKRIYVDSFGDDTISKELQSMIVSSLVATKRFKVTENREKADAILKGVALEKTSQEIHAYGESTSVGGAAGAADVNGAGFAAHHMGISDSSVNTETKSEARIAIRLVSPEGDVIWTSTQESKGAKYKGASADVADQCVKQLLRDVAKLEQSSVSVTPPTSANSTTH